MPLADEMGDICLYNGEGNLVATYVNKEIVPLDEDDEDEEDPWN